MYNYLLPCMNILYIEDHMQYIINKQSQHYQHHMSIYTFNIFLYQLYISYNLLLHKHSIYLYQKANILIYIMYRQPNLQNIIDIYLLDKFSKYQALQMIIHKYHYIMYIQLSQQNIVGNVQHKFNIFLMSWVLLHIRINMQYRQKKIMNIVNSQHLCRVNMLKMDLLLLQNQYYIINSYLQHHMYIHGNQLSHRFSTYQKLQLIIQTQYHMLYNKMTMLHIKDSSQQYKVNNPHSDLLQVHRHIVYSLMHHMDIINNQHLCKECIHLLKHQMMAYNWYRHLHHSHILGNLDLSKIRKYLLLGHSLCYSINIYWHYYNIAHNYYFDKGYRKAN